jgi:hypothetical protein
VAVLTASSAKARATVEKSVAETIAGDIRVYENSSPKGVFSNIFTNGATYKIQRTGSTITYLINDVVITIDATASSTT